MNESHAALFRTFASARRESGIHLFQTSPKLLDKLGIELPAKPPNDATKLLRLSTADDRSLREAGLWTRFEALVRSNAGEEALRAFLEAVPGSALSIIE